MNITRKIGLLAIFMSTMFLLFSCDQGTPFKDLQDYLAALKAGKSTAAAEDSTKTKSDTAPVSTKYQAGKQRSPFKVMEVETAKSGASSHPLHSYPLDMLRFVGTVTQNDKTIAFITAPDNRIYEVKVGDVIGNLDSKIESIDSDSISLVEQHSENGKEAMKRVVTIQLKESNK
tara:strand:+ start:49 stop:570 length:522 start_codon:yes stop_codon:yes gene_type:complete